MNYLGALGGVKFAEHLKYVPNLQALNLCNAS